MKVFSIFRRFLFAISEKSRNFASVIELQRHIEILLLANDCVIVPEFGGFITHNVPARYDTSDNSFLPPLRTLGFNPQLRMNDSVLAQSYVEAYDISYPEAVRRIEAEVAELKQQLEEEGHYTLTDLGELTVNQEGNYEFAPCESGILSPNLYGLGSFSFKRLKDKVAEEVERPQTAVASEATIVALQEQTEEQHLLEFSDDEEDDSSAISIKMTWIRNAVAVAAAVVAFFFIATPVANSDLGTPTMSQLQHSILYKLIPQDTTLPAMEPVAEAPVAEKVVEEAPAAEKVVAEKIVAEKPAVTYCIIVASQVKESNAELYVEKLKKNGYPNAYVYISNHVVRVVSDEFASQAEAYRVLNKMNMNEEFYDAWVYKKVNG
jgi:hypothetical protein